MDFYDRLQLAKNLPPRGINKRAQTIRSMQRSPSKTPPSPPRAWIQVDKSAKRQHEELIAQMSPGIAKAYNVHLRKTAEELLKKWPVATGLSRSLLDLSYTYNGGVITGSISNAAPYVVYIRKNRFIREHLFSRVNKIADDMAKAIAENIK